MGGGLSSKFRKIFATRRLFCGFETQDRDEKVGAAERQGASTGENDKMEKIR